MALTNATSYGSTFTGQPSSGALVAFVTMQVLGANIMLPILVLTFLFTNARRHPALINLCIAFIVTGTTLCLLFYAGQLRPTPPDSMLCLAQASIAWAVAPLASMSVMCLLYTVWTSVKQPTQNAQQQDGLDGFARTVIVIIAPYVVFVAYAVAGIAVALAHPENVSLSPDVVFFCTIGASVYTTSTSIGTALFLFIGMYFEVRIGIVLWRSMRARRKLPSGFAEPRFDMQFVPRVFIFGGYLAFGFIFTIMSIIRTSLAPDIFAATLPVFFGLLFGSQTDVREAWKAIFRRGALSRMKFESSQTSMA